MTQEEMAAFNDALARDYPLDDPSIAQLKAAAKADCRDCDGTGVFYGNVCVCGCIDITQGD